MSAPATPSVDSWNLGVGVGFNDASLGIERRVSDSLWVRMSLFGAAALGQANGGVVAGFEGELAPEKNTSFAGGARIGLRYVLDAGAPVLFSFHGDASAGGDFQESNSAFLVDDKVVSIRESGGSVRVAAGAGVEVPLIEHVALRLESSPLEFRYRVGERTTLVAGVETGTRELSDISGGVVIDGQLQLRVLF